MSTSASAPHLSTPWYWRAALVAAVVVLAGAAYVSRGTLGPRGQAACGIVCFITLVAACSRNLRAVRWRTIFWGIGLQVALALFILKFRFEFTWGTDVNGQPIVYEVGGYPLFQMIGGAIAQFLKFTAAGATFVFGPLAEPAVMGKVFPNNGMVLACAVLPTIIFASSFFSLLYYLRVLQLVVWVMALVMMRAMRTSGAETLSAAANVFLGQTEAPLIVKPYVEKMTQSELLAMMVGGMATISGGVMAVYIQMGADPVAILTTSVMAAPCGLYLSKLLWPETETPQTLGGAHTAVQVPHSNFIDAVSAGASDGLHLALNVAAMLIAFLAMLAFADYLLAAGDQLLGLQEYWGWKERLSLRMVFSVVFTPLALLMGVEAKDLPLVADLLGTKLVANEFVAYSKLTTDYRELLSPRSFILATYALTGFANFGSVGIQLGGIGAMAPSRRGDLAKMGLKALFIGFVTTLVNASLASVMIDTP